MNKSIFYNTIQVAGVKSLSEAEMLARCGINFAGFPLVLDFHNEDLNKEEVKNLTHKLPENIKPVLITYLNKSSDIIELAYFTGINIIQVHGDINRDELEKLLQRKNFTIIKSLIVKQGNTGELLSNLKEMENFVHAFITDTYDETTGAKGATGKLHDHSISKTLVAQTKKPVILAGGLTPENVFDAIIKVKPAGVDCHTGVENKNGFKNRVKVCKFLSEANRAFKLIRN